MIIFIITISFIAGILWGLYLKISIIPFLIPIIIFIKRKKLIIFLVPCLIASMYTSYLEKQYQTKYKNITGEITAVGTIVSNAEEKEYSYQYKLKLEKLVFEEKEQKQCKNTQVLLKIKKEKNNKTLNYGDQILLNGEFEYASEARNYGGFNYREYLKTKNIYGIITSKSAETKLIKEKNENIINILANATASKIKENINKILPEKQANLLTGILIGDKTDLSDDIQENFKDSNLAHMLAISGAHVSYIILGLTFALNKIGKKISKILTMTFLIFFTILTGMTPSVQRAVIMSTYILVANLIHKKPNILISISLSMLILLIENPYNLFDVGFQLSYAGTAGIILLNKKIKIKESKIKIIQKIKEMMIITLSANIMIIPIMMIHYNTISFTFLISNILASPILGIIIILGFIIVLISFVINPIIIKNILEIFLNILITIAEFSSKLPLSKIYVVTPNMVQIIAYYLAVFKRRKKYIIIFLIITIIMPKIHIFAGNLKINFIDVGQGDSTLIITPYGKNIIIDGGGSRDENFDVGKNTLLPYLLDRQIEKIDFLIISHFDSDHVRRVINNFARATSRKNNNLQARRKFRKL